MSLLINFAKTRLLKIGSGSICRFTARRLRDITFFPFILKILHCALSEPTQSYPFAKMTFRSHPQLLKTFASPIKEQARGLLLRLFSPVFGSALFAVFDSSAVQRS